MTRNFHKDYESGMDSGYYLSAGRQGFTTNPTVANQLGELARTLNAGVQNVEVGTMQMDLLDSIPDEHLDEMKRLSKLTGARISMHAPMIEPAGFSKQGWSEDQRKEAEIEFKHVLDRAHKLDPEGNIPVNLHATGGVPGPTYSPEPLPTEDGGTTHVEQMIGINRQTGQMVPLKHEVLQYIGKEKIYTPEERLENINQTTWRDAQLEVMNLQQQKNEIEQMKEKSNEQLTVLQYGRNVDGKNVLTLQEQKQLEKLTHQQMLYDQHEGEINSHIMSRLHNLYNQFKEFTPRDVKKDPEFKEMEKQLKKIGDAYQSQQEIDMQAKLKFGRKLMETEDPEQRMKLMIEKERWVKEKMNERKVPEKITPGKLIGAMSGIPLEYTPDLFVTSDEFAADKGSKTVGNAAFYAYDKYGDTTPTIVIENFFPTTALSRADSLKDMVIKSRKEFAKKLIDKKGMNKKEAKRTAEKVIGATWDMGHINLLKKQGFTDKEIIKETKKIAPYVKHAHITDNFGHSDAHLGPGMGNVPVKRVMEELEKAGFEGRGIIEAGGLANHYKMNPSLGMMEYFDSPLYTYEGGPSWADIRDTYAPYGLGMGMTLPQQHFNMHGASFVPGLPRELGGQQAGGDKSRFSGTPNV
ncbi:MAG: TIM barrel protein [Nanoarchaeota archaeon]